jgi:outer membrane protein
VSTSYDYLSISGSADVLLFGWFQKRNTIAKNSLSLQAARVDLEQLQNDVSLNVATGFLRALLAKEQIKISKKQVDLSEAQLHQTVEFVKAGRLPELNAAQLESQLANDSTNLINSISNYNSAVLDIKALLNLDFATPFNIEAPQVNLQDQINLASLNPEMIYNEATKHFGTIRSSELRIAAARKGLWAAKGNMMPSLSLSAQVGTNYATSYSEVYDYEIGNPTATNAFVKVDTNTYTVYQTPYKPLTRKIPFNNQISNNFRQTLTFGMNFPLFNGWQASNFRKQSEINVQMNELNRDQAALRLKQDVYKAYNEAMNAFQKYQSANRAVDAARRAYDFAQKRYQLGLTNTVEYLTTQNNQFISESNLLSAKYDLIFKLKVIDYYLGKELKL